MALLKPCLDCGDLTSRKRCDPCWAEHERKRERAKDRKPKESSTERGYDWQWQKLSMRARKLQPFCLFCGTTENLSGDHKRWPARNLNDVNVLCISCNSKKGAARKRVLALALRDDVARDERRRAQKNA